MGTTGHGRSIAWHLSSRSDGSESFRPNRSAQRSVCTIAVFALYEESDTADCSCRNLPLPIRSPVSRGCFRSAPISILQLSQPAERERIRWATPAAKRSLAPRSRPTDSRRLCPGSAVRASHGLYVRALPATGIAWAVPLSIRRATVGPLDRNARPRSPATSSLQVSAPVQVASDDIGRIGGPHSSIGPC